MKRTLKLSYPLLVLIAGISLTSTGCTQLVGGLLTELFNIVGTTPASDFGQTGRVSFSMLPQGSTNGAASAGFQTSGAKVQVKNDDGTYSDCEPVGETPVEPSDFNSLTLLIDDSGSMERTYPEEEYGDLCLTCPHDPNQERKSASRELIRLVHAEAPESKITVLDFGPTPDEGRIATRVLHDFSDQTDSLIASLDAIDGSQLAGTPLWDALAESMIQLDADADEFEAVLQGRGVAKQDARRYIVVLSDGADYDSTMYNLDQVIALALEYDVAVYAVGLGTAAALAEDNRFDDQDDRARSIQDLQRLARETGGFYASVTSPGALQKLFSDVAGIMTRSSVEATYECKPRVEHDDEEPRDCEPGEEVEGNILYTDGSSQTWSVIAP